MVLAQALTWEGRDVDGEYLIHIFGKTENGKSMCVTTQFKPYFFVKVYGEPRVLFQKIREAVRGNIANYELVKCKDLWGFQNNKSCVFMKLNFYTMEDLKRCDSRLRKPLQDDPVAPKVYESNIDPVLRLMHRSNIQSTGWFETGEACQRCSMAKVDIDLFCNDWKTLSPVKRDDNAPFVVASFDIECHSSTGKFPDADVEGDECFQIAITLRKMGHKEIYNKTCLCYPDTDAIEDATIIVYPNEADLLVGFTEFLHEHNVDILTGWNIFGFDLEYMYKRSLITKCVTAFSNLGRLKDCPSEMNYKKLSSSALGDNILKLLPMSGRYIFDLFQEVKKEQKLDSYSLNSVSEHFLGDKKIDMPPKEIFRRYSEGDPTELSEVAEYCVKDTLLPHYLLDKLCTLLNLFEMAKATWVPIFYLSERGQQIKVFSQMTRKARELGFMVPTIRYGSIQHEQYEGATVLEAHTGAYYTPITALDFEGLYPSIMIAHNLCYSTFVMNPQYDNLPGVEYETFTIDGKTYKFAQNVPSLLPNILLELKAFRKAAKKDMANSEGDMKKVYNGKQLAYKISMNSVYGFTGAGKGMLPCVPIAATVTAEGRHMIEQTKEKVEECFPGAKVRYGDSVTPDTPLLVRIDGVVKTARIDSLVEKYIVRDDGKEIGDLNAEVWTESGFTQIVQVVRHKTTKNIFRVLTHTGVVDVTEDHSLLLPDATKITPSEVTVNTKLLHGDSVDAVSSTYTSVSLEEAKVMGFFFGDGSCGEYNGKYTWAINNSNMNYLLQIQELCPFETKIYDTIKSSGVYKLNALGDVKQVSKRYRELFYNSHKQKVVPPCILNAPYDVAEAFIEGYYMADGDKDYTRMDCKGKEGTMGLAILGRKLGYNVSLNTRSDKLNIFRQTWTKSSFRKDPTAIKKIEHLGEVHEYVYDLTTVSHHFAVGPGELVVHNTDSVMVEFDMQGRTGQEAIEYSWELGEQAAEICNAMFKKPKNLELEKVYWPYYLYSKKRYAAKLWVKGKDNKMKMDYIDVKGLQLVRRDNTPYVREVCKELLDVLMESNNPERAKELAHQRAVELLDGKVPQNKLVLSQKLAESYKSDSQAHVRVRDKMREREPGSEPQCGDRVPYVIIKTGDKKHKAFEKSEDPVYALKNNIPLDYEYYFTNKFMKPVCDLLEPVVEKDEVFGDLVAKKKPRPSKNTTIDQFFK